MNSVLCCSTTMQYVILTYMKHLGVKVKEPRSLEPKRVRINFLPKIKVQHTHTQTHQLCISVQYCSHLLLVGTSHLMQHKSFCFFPWWHCFTHTSWCEVFLGTKHGNILAHLLTAFQGSIQQAAMLCNVQIVIQHRTNMSL